MSGPRYHRNRRAVERLVGYECQSCGWVAFPTEKRCCKQCGKPGAPFEEVALAEEGEIQTFVVQEFLPDEFESPQPLAIVDIPQVAGDGEPVRVYGLVVETDADDLAIGDTVDARFREMFTDGERPIHSFKFAKPREERL